MQPAETVAFEDVQAQENGWDRRRRRIAEHIEGVALTLFVDRGYRNVTVAEVAEAAGVSTRTITRYFPLKEDLLLSMPRRSATGAIEGLRAAWEVGHSVRDIWTIWATLARDNAADVQRLTMFWHAAKDVPEILDRARGEQHDRVRTVLTELVREGMQDGPDADLHARVIASALQAANTAIVEHWMRSNREVDLAVTFASATSVLAREIGGLDGSRRRRRSSTTPS